MIVGGASVVEIGTIRRSHNCCRGKETQNVQHHDENWWYGKRQTPSDKLAIYLSCIWLLATRIPKDEKAGILTKR